MYPSRQTAYVPLKMKILLIDNSDSFTHNLLHLTESVCRAADRVEVRHKDELTVGSAGGFDRILFSPGPGIPSESPVLGRILRKY